MPDGVLVLHGLTGSRQSVQGLADSLASTGLEVSVPLLPGHGTSIHDLLATDWSDWSAAAEAAFFELGERCTRVVVAGLSMGGSLALWLAARHQAIAGLVLVNPLVAPPAHERVALQELLDAGIATVDAIGGDLADPDAHEDAYDQLAIPQALSLYDAVARIDLAEVRCPVLVFTSRADHVVDPVSSDALVAGVAGPVEQVHLDRSFHVATLDFDRGLVESRAVAWVAALLA